MRTSNVYLVSLALAVTAGAAIHFKSIHQLQLKLDRLERQIATIRGDDQTEGFTRPVADSTSDSARPAREADVSLRLFHLEQAVAQLSRTSEYLMERGQIPLATNKLEDLYAKLADPAVPDDEKLRALRLLRRNRGLNDQAVYSALAWLQTASDPRMKRELLEHLDGATNAALKQPLLHLAAAETNARVREQAVENLRPFVGDTQVENLLWNRLQDEPDEDVRDEIQAALRRGPASEARLAELQKRALNPQGSLEERLVALRALREAKADTSGIIPAMAEMAQNSRDPAQRVQLFRAFDGFNDPALKGPLVHGLQDPNPVVREEAADALSGFASDPLVQQWLRHVAETDADSRVRREAFQALQNRGRP